MAQSKLDYVDVLRGLAILGVFWLHFSGDSNFMDWLPASLVTVFQQGGRGVQLFFIASAFTLFRSYHYRAPLEAQPVRNFFIRRFFRIAPMYYIGIIYYLMQDGFGPRPFLGATVENSPDSIVANVLFLHEFNPYYMWLVPGSWSIATEMMFYLIVPWLVRWVPDLRAAIRLVLLSLVFRAVVVYGLTFLKVLPPEPIWREYLFFFLPGQLPVFALGIMLFFILRGDAWPKLAIWEILLACALLFTDVLTGVWRVLPTHFTISLAFVGMAIAFSRMSWDHIPGRILRHIGKVSFSLYLCHWAVMYGMSKLGLIEIQASGYADLIWQYAWRMALALSVAVGISTITYQLFELPGQKLGSKLILYLDRRKLASTKSI